MSRKKKTKQQSSSRITWGYQTAPETADIRALRDEIDDDSVADPSIQYRAARQKQSLKNRVNNQFGANYSPETAEAIEYAGERDIDLHMGQEIKEDAYRRKLRKLQARFGLAGLTKPQLVQTGGSSQGTATSSTPFNWMGLINTGLQTAAAI